MKRGCLKSESASSAKKRFSCDKLSISHSYIMYKVFSFLEQQCKLTWFLKMFNSLRIFGINVQNSSAILNSFKFKVVFFGC